MDGHAHGSSLSCCLAGADGSRGSGRGRGRDQQNRLQTVLGRQSHHARHSPRAQEDRSGRPRYSATAGPAGHRDLCCLAPNPHRMRQRQATELVLVRLLSRLFGAATPATGCRYRHRAARCSTWWAMAILTVSAWPPMRYRQPPPLQRWPTGRLPTVAASWRISVRCLAFLILRYWQASGPEPAPPRGFGPDRETDSAPHI